MDDHLTETGTEAEIAYNEADEIVQVLKVFKDDSGNAPAIEQMKQTAKESLKLRVT